MAVKKRGKFKWKMQKESIRRKPIERFFKNVLIHMMDINDNNDANQRLLASFMLHSNNAFDWHWQGNMNIAAT